MTERPPMLAQRLLLRFLRDDLAEEVIGDLDENFYSTCKKKSLFRARLNYWYQVLNYLRPFAIKKSRPTYLNHYDMFESYFKIGYRNLLKNKGYSFINIGGLAAGMAVAMLIGLWIYDELSFNKYHQNYERIGMVMRHNIWRGEIHSNDYQVTGLGTLLRSAYGSHFKSVVMVKEEEEHIIAYGDKKFTQSGDYMQSEGPEMLSLKMISGTWGGLKEMNSILLSESLAKKLFGDSDPMDQTVTIDVERVVKVTGVYEDLPKNSHFRNVTFIAPMDLFILPANWISYDTWDNYNVAIYVQLHAEKDFEKISGIIKDAMTGHVDAETASTKPEIFLHPMSKWHLHSEFKNKIMVTSNRMRSVWYYGMIGSFVLLLACINFMNLSTARSEKRAKEVGIRKTIGSIRSQLINQFLSESLFVTALAFVLSIVLVKLILPWFNGVADKDIQILWTNQWFWITCIGFALFTALLAGSYPAFYLSSFNPIKALKGSLKSGRVSSVPRKVLIVVQFTVSIALMIGTVIVYQQIQFGKNRPVGYSREGLLMLAMRSPEYKGKYESLRNELKKTGVVQEVALSGRSIMDLWGWNPGFDWEGRDDAFDPSFNTIWVSHEYGKTIGWEFLEGRDFSKEFPADINGIVLNESALKLMGLQNPVGETVTWKTQWNEGGTFKIIGVVKDMVKGSPFDKTEPSVIFLSEKDDLGWLYIKINPAVSFGDALPRIENAFSKIITSAPFDYAFADDAYDSKFRGEERVGKLAGFFSVLAVVISCLGLFGLASYTAEQRTKEIGIRKVLGASISNLWQMLSKDFVMLVMISWIVAMPSAFLFMEKWLQQYEYRTTITWNVFVAIGSGSLIITLFTVSFQAIKAAMENPVNSLKSE